MSAQCDKAPRGWKCTRKPGHDGPCAAVKVPWYKQALSSVGNALGQALFGGSR